MNSFRHPQFEEGDLIENLDIDNLDHAEKFLLVTVSHANDYGAELICGNGNRWALPKNYINHGNVVCAYSNLRKQLTP